MARVQVATSEGMQYLESVPRRVVTLYIPLGIFVFVLLFPFYWMGTTSLKPNAELLSREGNPFWVAAPIAVIRQKLIREIQERLCFNMPPSSA